LALLWAGLPTPISGSNNLDSHILKSLFAQESNAILEDIGVDKNISMGAYEVDKF
jgi:hypothetical protein